jgi:hypothetical protein
MKQCSLIDVDEWGRTMRMQIGLEANVLGAMIERMKENTYIYINIETNEMEKLANLHSTSMIVIAKNQTSSKIYISPRATPCKQR